MHIDLGFLVDNSILFRIERLVDGVETVQISNILVKNLHYLIKICDYLANLSADQNGRFTELLWVDCTRSPQFWSAEKFADISNDISLESMQLTLLKNLYFFAIIFERPSI